ncbi:MAG: GNAT family N-acetyltransferase [Lachnospiraceae bacterium]|nr:GNAT family N-acetyltransferase [Lachnospiraceae bacterium]
MNKQESILLLDSMYPNFFKRENVRNIPDEWICDEMILSLDKFEPYKYDKKLEDNISFGYYEGDIDELKKMVERVVQYWAQSYNKKQRIYCGYVNGKIASFCLVEDMGVYNINGREVKIGGPGCVGTLPEYRNKGIGLTMIKHVTQILKEEGFDYSYIHFTGVAPWYEKLGYKTSIKWTKNGIL